jgi:hypothetical protein
MALPKQVQQQINEVSDLEQQLYGDDTAATPETTVSTVVEPEAEQEVPAGESEVVDDDSTAEVEPTKPDGEDLWKQKYKTLQGMYDAEVPRLHSQVKDLSGELEALKNQVLESQKAADAAEKQAAHEARVNLVTDDDRQEFGDELIEVQRKVAREETADLIARFEALEAENAQLKQQLDDTGARVVTASFEQRLTQLVPDFAEVNVDPRWINWLNEEDPMLRGPRMTAAQAAYAEGDAEGVAHFVTLFKESLQPVDTEDSGRAQELENQIQPSTSGASLPPQNQPGTLTDADIRAMFTKVMSLNAAGRLDEARKLEAEIDAAYQEGRVVP